jgi:hypothetical protein
MKTNSAPRDQLAPPTQNPRQDYADTAEGDGDERLDDKVVFQQEALGGEEKEPGQIPGLAVVEMDSSVWRFGEGVEVADHGEGNTFAPASYDGAGGPLYFGQS